MGFCFFPFQVSFWFLWCRFPIEHSSIGRRDTFGGVGWAFALDFFSPFTTSIRAVSRFIISTGQLFSFMGSIFLLYATILHLSISSLLMLLCLSAFVRVNHILSRSALFLYLPITPSRLTHHMTPWRDSFAFPLGTHSGSICCCPSSFPAHVR
ncbi:hypothetical protein CGRA01v4_10136 [Colletotrichum graminicola]|nr:hypothetical protein CGRA01v4_10136 [Colletotrichum graminicola]